MATLLVLSAGCSDPLSTDLATPPIVTIATPVNDAGFTSGAVVSFTGMAQDHAGSQLTGPALVWASNRDGNLGSGGTISSTVLTTGEHKITLTATDAAGSSAAAGVTITVTPPLIPSTITSGGNHTCALSSTGVAFCWGWNGHGQLGTGNSTSSSTPVPVAGGLKFTLLTAGEGHTCGRATSGESYCWGDNEAGELGTASFASSNVPALVHATVQFTRLSAGGKYTCGLTASGSAYCWGQNTQGRLGVGDLEHRRAPAAVAGGHSFKSIETGNSQQTCAVTTASRGYCWGDNGFHQLGLGLPLTVSFSLSPLPVSTEVDFRTIHPGEWFSCGLSTGGQAYCWGANYGGRLGNSLIGVTQASPYKVIGDFSYSEISVGRFHTCARTNQVVYCWGQNTVGQLGDNSTASRGSPRVVNGNHSFGSVSAGNSHNCALTPAGAAYCWGANGAGQLGDGTKIDRWEPRAAAAWPSP
ncbi:hypothetical protein BH23GEM8_BH23GEM8_01290 [soil metagenome]